MNVTLTDAELQAIGEQVVDVLRSIYDPEIPVDIYELGLIYDVQVSTDRDVHILMTLTSPNCPVAESLPQEVREKTRSLDDVREVEVELTFDQIGKHSDVYLLGAILYVWLFGFVALVIPAMLLVPVAFYLMMTLAAD